jgi:tetratricopeptide (TPR) repeat protein
MRRLLAWPRRRLMVVGLGAVVLAGLSPFLWAAYHWYAAQSALDRYRTAEARPHLHACLRIWPWSRSVRVHLLAARAARREGDFDEAAQRLHECQDTLHDTSPETVLEWAMLHASLGELDTVAEPLKTRLRQEPQFAPLILESLTEGYLRMSRILDALGAVDSWLTLEPNNPRAWFLRGNTHRQVGAWQEAAADYRHVMESDAEYPNARRSLAVALLKIGRYEEAVQQFEILRHRQPHDADVLVNLALCHQLAGRNDEARVLLDAVLAEHPEDGAALRTRGQVALASGQLAEAEKWLRQAVRVLPYDLKAQVALWDCLRQQNKTAEMETERVRMEELKDRWTRQSEIVTRLMSQKPDDPALQCELGVLYTHLGRPEIGEAWLLNALRLDEHYGPALEELAKYYQQRGDEDKAEDYRQRARAARELPNRARPRGGNGTPR